MITTQDKELLAKKGITEEQIVEQLACFQTGFPFLKLDAAASIEKGILAPDAEEQKAYLAAVLATSSFGRRGAGGVLSQAWVSSQSRTNCLS